jgi:hypothetical protein
MRPPKPLVFSPLVAAPGTLWVWAPGRHERGEKGFVEGFALHTSQL